MNTLVIYDSKYGNTKKIAETIGKELALKCDTNVIHVDKYKHELLKNLNLLIVGSPTHAFRSTKGIKGFLKKLPKNFLSKIKIAAFDTRFDEAEIDKVKILKFMVNIFGYADKSISKELIKKGGEEIFPSKGFIVNGEKGPLAKGEIKEAKKWAKKIIKKMNL